MGERAFARRPLPDRQDPLGRGKRIVQRATEVAADRRCGEITRMLADVSIILFGGTVPISWQNPN